MQNMFSINFKIFERYLFYKFIFIILPTIYLFFFKFAKLVNKMMIGKIQIGTTQSFFYMFGWISLFYIFGLDLFFGCKLDETILLQQPKVKKKQIYKHTNKQNNQIHVLPKPKMTIGCFRLNVI